MSAEPGVVERVRMALAEAGYPQAYVVADGDAFAVTREVPAKVAWHVGNVVSSPSWDGRPGPCFACFIAANDLSARTVEERGWDCLARGQNIEDCGVERGAS